MAAEARWLWGTVAATLGALVLAVLLAPSAKADAPGALTALLFLTSSVHVASTAALYALPEVRAQARVHRSRHVVVPLALVVAAAAVAGIVTTRQLTWLLLGYFAWQQLHFQKQNLGMAALAAAAVRVPGLHIAERRALVASGIAGAVGLVAHPGLLQLDVQPHLGPVFVGAGVLFVIVAVGGLAALGQRTPAERPAGFTAVYVTSLLFSAPVFLFSSPYAAVAGLTMAHGAQYLLLLSHISAGRTRGVDRLIALALLANVALIGGALLNAASHLHTSSGAVRMLYGAYLGLVMAHFVVDAGIWRLRDPAARAFVTGRLPWLVAS